MWAARDGGAAEAPTVVETAGATAKAAVTAEAGTVVVMAEEQMAEAMVEVVKVVGSEEAMTAGMLVAARVEAGAAGWVEAMAEAARKEVRVEEVMAAVMVAAARAVEKEEEATAEVLEVAARAAEKAEKAKAARATGFEVKERAVARERWRAGLRRRRRR